MKKYEYIPGSNGYGISRCGELVRLPREVLHNINKTTYTSKLKILKPSANNSKGYLRKTIYYLDGTIIYESIHRLVAKVFIPNPEDKPQVNHINANKLDNRVENLEWVTNDENMYHAATVIGQYNQPKGDKNHNSKLTEEQVKLLPELLKTKLVKDIAREWGVGDTTICEIRRGRSWRYLNLFPPRGRPCEKYYSESRYVPTTTET